MAKQDKDASYWSTFASASLYKRNQGRVARQLTAVGLGVVVFYGLWTWAEGPLTDYAAGIRFGVPIGLAVLTAWALFRLVHWPKFAEFLIAVEAEMSKVSWPGKDEVHRSTIVVLFTMFFLGFTLFAYDIAWKAFFRAIGVLQL